MSPMTSPRPAKTVVILCLFFVNKTCCFDSTTSGFQWTRILQGPKETRLSISKPNCMLNARLTQYTKQLILWSPQHSYNPCLYLKPLDPRDFASLLPASISYNNPANLTMCSLGSLPLGPLFSSSPPHLPPLTILSHCPIPDVSGGGIPHSCNRKTSPQSYLGAVMSIFTQIHHAAHRNFTNCNSYLSTFTLWWRHSMGINNPIPILAIQSEADSNNH